VALRLIDGIDPRPHHLDRYHLYHAIRADLLRRLGQHAEAADAYEAAIALSRNMAERDFLQRAYDAMIQP
jgi:RNA polymerase sigma-70 factor (ECF subfamily)